MIGGRGQFKSDAVVKLYSIIIDALFLHNKCNRKIRRAVGMFLVNRINGSSSFFYSCTG